MQHLPQGFGSLFVEGGLGPFGTRRFGHKSIQATLVGIVDGVAHRLLAASEVPGYLRNLSSPLEGAKSIWERRKVKASLERREASSRSRSSFESLRTKMGGFMALTVTHNPKSALDVH